MSGNQKLDPIRRACQVEGRYIISVGSWEPAVVLRRLLRALRLLDPEAHRIITAPGSEYASIPLEALEEDSNPWWNTEGAQALLHDIVTAINCTAPDGFVCVPSGPEGSCLELVRLYPLPNPGASE